MKSVSKSSIKVFVIAATVVFAAAYFFQQSSVTIADRSPVVPVADENHLPEIMEQRHKTIGLGQRLFFGIEVIDPEGDLVRTELIEKPKTAKFNQATLTVDWTPTPAEPRNAKFVVKVTEIPRDPKREQRSFTKEFTIRVVKQKVKLLEMPKAPLEVDAFVSIIDPERLAAVNKRWDIITFFQRIAEIEADKQIKPGNGISPTTGKQLFHDAMKQLAVIHKNPSLDPDDPKFNPEWNAEHWRIVAIRPRMNKKLFELRFVFFNVAAPEQAYLMPRMRIARGKDAGRPEDQRQKNNLAFAKMFHDAFFDGDKMKPFVAGNKAEYGKALEKFVAQVLTYNDPDDPMMRANLAAVPHNSRLGGGSAYDANGKYLYGDGWALGAMKVTPVVRDGKKVLAFTSPFIDGFAASIKPNKDGTAFRPVPPPASDPANAEFIKGWDHLIDDDDKGNIAIPMEMPDGSIARSNIDTTLNRFEVPSGFRFAENGFRDARRRIFEERGMTCIQCHVRDFDEGNYLLDMNDPKKNPSTATETVGRVFFIITPTLHSGRSEYMLRNEIAQVGGMQGVFRDYLGINVKINSPLAADWPHTTKYGKR
ncbi:MAG TPA: hypothetical protein PKO33_01950 [Pyrinomonadaceae bacterium]|nr:hypothetical protein [Pyrinomonadaceae bacterium]